MSKHDTMVWVENVREGIIHAVTWLKTQWALMDTSNRRVVSAVLATLLLMGLYSLSNDANEQHAKVLSTRDSEFKKTRVLGDPYAATSIAKEQMLIKNAKGFADAQKALVEGLARIDTRLVELEGKILTLGRVQDLGKPDSNSDLGTSATATATNQADKIPQQEPIGVPSQLPEPTQHVPFVPLASGESYRQGLKSATGPQIISFPVTGSDKREHAEVVLPVGSYVKAKLLTGVEAPEGTPYPVLLQLDFANILPNRKSLDLSGCFMIAKAQGDLSTERVQMQATKLSCVSKDGNMFEREINGFVADDKDNSFAVIGSVNTKQDRVAAMAFLSSVVEGVGRAIQMAQTTEQTSPEGTSRRLLTGDQGKYIASGGASQAAGMVAQWYLKQAQNLLPTINVGSGQDLWVVMNESVALPNDYFKKVSSGGSHGQDYSIVNHLFD